MARHTGIGTYLKGLLTHLGSQDLPPQWKIILFGKVYPKTNGQGFCVKPFYSKIYSLQEQLEYPFRLRQCQLWHAPHYNIPLVKGKTKLIVTIHDLIHWIFRKHFFTPIQGFYAEKMLQRAVGIADHIITVSQKTRSDLIEYFDADPEKISVIYEGVSSEFRELKDPGPVDEIRKKYHLPPTFFLYVGMLKPHKNVLWLLHLFRHLRKEGKVDASLVLIGKKDKRYPRGYEELAKLKTGLEIIHISYVEHEELVAFYNGALALIHPSLYEGFGLTLLEAMACGTPVIACRSASVPEIAGEGAYLIESCADYQLQDAIVRLEKFPALREEWRRKGKQQACRFQWDQTAEETVKVYERVLSDL